MYKFAKFTALIRHLKPSIVYCCNCLENDPQKSEENTIQDYVKGAQAVNRVVWIFVGFRHN